MDIHRGVIEDFSGSWGSGIAMLRVSGRSVPCENSPTVRALDSCFGGFITPGHSVNPEAIRGQEIVYGMEDWGVLAWFCPADDYDGPAPVEDQEEE